MLGPRLLTGLAVLLLAVGAGAVVSSPDAGSSAGRHARDETPPGVARSDWHGVLRSLDRTRSQAWRRGEPAALGGVYPAGSPLLRQDRADLRAYARRGFRVAGVSTSYDVVDVASATSDRVRLVVVDRLGPSRAVSSSGLIRALPRDDVARHSITLRRTAAGWRIAVIRPTA